MNKVFFLAILFLVSCDTTTTQEEDKQRLQEQLDNLYAMVENEPCEDASTWRFTAIGSKPCGGPMGYIAYPSTINESNFLEQVQAYTTAQLVFNKKWGIFSDCTPAPYPTGIICEDGEAVLQYN